MKCSNINCEVIKIEGQLCRNKAKKEHLTNKSKVITTFCKPQKAKDGRWYCSDFE